MKPAVLLTGLALVCGCSTHPLTGRDQILALPAVQIAYAEVGFAIATGARLLAAPSPCERDCDAPESPARFTGRVETIGTQLETSARSMSPELFGRIERFQIEVSESLGVGTSSSAGGRIALGAELVMLEPSDAVIAFMLAREMAHVIARHAEENSGAVIVTSALGMLLPGIGAVARFVACTLASNALKGSWATQQRQEADEISVALLARSGHPVFSVARDLESVTKHARLPDNEWGARLIESAGRVALMAAARPRYAVLAE